ncbi:MULTISPECIES: hypothetical protein [Acinetobacter]|uniref:hypothetical protein n=1 Tax=Acinetobacter TaxID=469 RepID=UPI001488879A|nr:MULTISPECIES: hypothetical protein [Acinetobacter]
MSDKDNKFSLKFLGATMEAMNLKPENFVKVFWHLAFIAVFIMAASFLIQVAKFYLGM